MKPISVLYDLVATQPVSGTMRHGGGRYGEIVLERIIARQLPVICFYDGKKWLNPTIKELLVKNSVKLYDICRYNLKEIITLSQANVLYSALPSNAMIKQNNIRVIGTIHGLRRLETPVDNFCFRYRNQNWKDWLFYLAKKLANRYIRNLLCSYYKKAWENSKFQMVTVSNHTANAIKYFFPDMKGRNIPVFYSPSTSTSSNLQKKIYDKYFLMVSANRCEKNNLRAIMALDQLFSNGYLIGYNVKITGAKDSSNFRYKIKNTNRFEFLGYVEDKDLEQLYHDAYALVYPSLNEGFGYPPLESMHYGVPVLASSYSSISEVCQGASIYFNPFAIEEIANRLLQIADEQTHKRYSDLAARQYQIISEKQQSDLDGLIDFIYTKE